MKQEPTPPRRRQLLVLAVLIAIVAGGSAALADPAAAAPSAAVASDAVQITVAKGGSLSVTEKISYTFGSGSGSGSGSGAGGFVRRLTTRIGYGSTHYRIYPVHAVQATTGGARVPVQLHTSGATTELRVDRDAKRSGTVRYTLTYTVDGVLTRSPDGLTLQWPGVGGWDVLVASADIVVLAAVTHVSCTSGRPGSSQPCTVAEAGGTTFPGGAHVQQDGLPAGAALTVTVGLPAGSATPGPILTRRHTVATAFSLTGWTVGAAIGLLVLAALALGAVWVLRGRDARAAEATGPRGGRRPFHRADGEAVFSPPGGLRPGQVGTLVDERVDPVDVVATILDLAVRNYLHIEELPGGRADWRLYRRNPADDNLLDYERAVYDEVFGADDVAQVSELSARLAAGLLRLRELMYRDVVNQGWFATRPDRTRRTWAGVGGVLAAGGVVATVLLALWTFQALLGPVLIITGLAAIAIGRLMPARTAKGSAVVGEIGGLRQYVHGADPADIPDADQEVLCARGYCPTVRSSAPMGAGHRRSRIPSTSERRASSGSPARTAGNVRTWTIRWRTSSPR